MKKVLFLFTGFLCLAMSLVSCSKDDDQAAAPSLTSPAYYIAGTITAEESERYSPYLIRFEEDGQAAHFINTTSVFPGKYSLRDDTLFFQTDDQEKIVVFEIKDNQITYSHYEVRFYQDDGGYEPAPVRYEATGELGQTPDHSLLAGKSFTGGQYRFGTEGVFQENFIYRFASSGSTYGSGTEDIDDQSFSYELLNNVAFRYQEGSTKEFGVLINGQLVAFRESGLFYWGTFAPR